MSRKGTTFFNKLVEYGNDTLTDRQKVSIAKKIYLIDNKDDILKAQEVGYMPAMIAEVATAELLEADIPKSIIVKTKEGEEVSREVKFTPAEIKKFCEPEGDA